MVVNIKDYSSWRESLSSDKSLELHQIGGFVKESFHFGLDRLDDVGNVFPVSGNFRRISGYDFFEGASMSCHGPAYVEGIFDNDKKVLKMIEFYELPHSLGNFNIYDIHGDENNIWKGNSLYNWRGEKPVESKSELITLENKFIDGKLSGLPHSNVVHGGVSPKALTEFWMSLKEQGFDVPQRYSTREERDCINGDETDDIAF